MADKKMPTLYRTVTLSLDRAEGQEPVIRAALSSEAPVQRQGWFDGTWVEILEHSKEAVDLGRAKHGLPLLLEHETREQIGRITEIAIDKDKTLRGTLTFSRSARAQEIKTDVLDGIRQEMSIGYQITKVRKTEKDNALTEVRALEWMPLEGSLVAVPADATVGVGRSLTIEPEERPMPDAPATPVTPTVRVEPDAGAVERERVKQITALARTHKVSNAKMDEAIDSGVTPAAFANRILESLAGGAHPITPPTDAPAVSDEDLERGGYSISRFLHAQAEAAMTRADPRKIAPFEMEVHDALMQRAEKSGNPTKGGFRVPMNLWVKPSVAAKARERLYFQRGAQEVATASKGGELKFTEPGPFIEVLRNRIFVRDLGARLLAGLQGDLQFPRQTGAQTAYWVPESATADVTVSNMTFDNMKLAPKPLSAQNSYSRKLLAQNIVDIDNLIRDDLVQVFAIEIDRAAINGVGSNNEPMGILNASGTNSVTAGANGGTVSYDLLVDVETQQAIANADRGALAYLTNPKVRGKLKKVAQISASTGIPAWFMGEVNGYRAEATNQVPSNLTKGTSTTICSAAVFANWPEGFIGQWGDIEFILDPYTKAARGDIVLTAYLMVDVGLRHPASFTVIKDLLTT